MFWATSDLSGQHFLMFCRVFFFLGNKGEMDCIQKWLVDCVQVKRFIQKVYSIKFKVQ